VVVWQSQGSAGTDSSASSVQARRFRADGTPRGPSFQVNTLTSGEQYQPAVAVAPDGRFVVVWSSDVSSGSDADGRSVQARRFGADGAPLGAEFQVNVSTPFNQDYPAVAADGGGFVIAWQSEVSAGTDTDGQSVQLRRYSAAGAPLGPELQVNSFTLENQMLPKVARAATGELVVAWSSGASPGTDSSAFSALGRRFAADGSPVGTDFQINDFTPGNQFPFGVAFGAEGEFVVAWQSYGSYGDDDDSYGIQARRFGADGTPLEGQFQVNTVTTGYQISPALAADAGGGFAVAWASASSAGGDVDRASVQARLFAHDGTPRGGQFQVNVWTTHLQFEPAVAAGPNGDLVVVWSSYGSAGGDDSGFSVQARRWDALFRDGFESGSAGRWSAIAP
jgi:hypothetical protein